MQVAKHLAQREAEAAQLVDQGLSEAEALARRARGLANGSPLRSSRSYLQILRENVFSFINNVLFGLGIALVILGRKSDALVTVGVACINVVVSTIQEVRAKRALDRIALLTLPQATVLRDGKERLLRPDEVVEGDVLQLRPGDQVVADGPLIGDGAVDVDESLLSGEAAPVAKCQGDHVYSGSFCVSGSGLYCAESVGKMSVANQLTSDARAFRRVLSPLQREINLVIRVMLVVAAFFELLLAVDAIVNDHPLVESVQDAVVVAGIVPIGLFLTITTAYAVGAVRLAGLGVLVQQANAVESLSHSDVLCLDKTGTLTSNLLRLHALHPLGVAEDELRQRLGDFVASLGTANRTSEAIGRDCPGQRRRALEEVPFSSARRWSAISWDGPGARGAYVLGAPDALLPSVSPTFHLGPYDSWTAEGLRVLLFAATPGPVSLHDLRGEVALPATLQPLGLLALADELRPEARETLAGFAAAGIAIKVISGDDPTTVAALAHQAGLDISGPVRSGTDLDGLDEVQLSETAETTTVFGRIAPRQKAKLVRALQWRGHHVAVIGDGVNDVLALKQADLGIAMYSGSSATRAAADIVLLDNSFAPLPQAFQEGQRIRNGMHNILKLFLSRIVFTVLLVLATAAVSDTFPFAPKQHAILSLLTGGIPALALAAWSRPGKTAGDGNLRSLLRFVAPAGATMSLAALLVLTVTLVVSRDMYVTAHPGAGEAAVLRHVEPIVQSAQTAFAVICGLLLLLFVEPPTSMWAVGAELSPDHRPALLALGLLAAYVFTLAVAALRTFFELQQLPVWTYALIAVAAVIWVVTLHWAWRARLLDRLFQTSPAR